MTVTLPAGARDLLDRPEFATLATINPDGQPQLSVVWVARDGDDLLVSTIKARRKTANLVRDPRATVLVYPASDPYRYLEVRGTVTLVDDPHADLIHELSVKYTGERFDGVVEQRVVVRLTPSTVVWYA